MRLRVPRKSVVTTVHLVEVGQEHFYRKTYRNVNPNNLCQNIHGGSCVWDSSFGTKTVVRINNKKGRNTEEFQLFDRKTQPLLSPLVRTLTTDVEPLMTF